VENIMDISKRFKEERERLGFSQVAFAELGDATKWSLINWEAGRQTPNGAYLADIATHGADVLYILTGKRSMAVAEVALLPNDERGLLDGYRRCSPAAKKSLIQTAALLAAGADQPATSITMRAGKNSKQVGSINAKGDVSF
jgi:DNA-binding XRE family transcriptional regulator